MLRPAADLIRTLRRAWTEGDLAYPCTNQHIMDEIAAAYAMTSVNGFTFGTLDKSDAPFFVELDTEGSSSPCVVHIWRVNYKRFLVHEFGQTMLQAFERVYREDLLLRAQLAAARHTNRMP